MPSRNCPQKGHCLGRGSLLASALSFNSSLGSRHQRRAQPLAETVSVAKLALPDRHDLPTEGEELSVHATVASDILLELCEPELGSALRSVRKFAAAMPMPEAAVSKDDGLVSS